MTKFGFFALFLMILPALAWADCAADAKETKARIAEIKDPGRKEEATKLIEKAEKDLKAGRVWLCADAVKRANLLMK
jgi:hypothetical protein